MAVSSNLELFLLTESMSAKATGVNTVSQALEDALSEQYNLDTSSATTAGDDVTIPFDDSTDLSSRTALRFIHLVLDAGATAAFDVIHPANKHMFFVTNNTSHNATLKVGASTGVTIANGASALVYCNGTDFIEIDMSVGGGGVSFPTQLEMQYVGNPPTSTEIARFIVADPIDFAADFAGSVGNVTTNPTATYAIDVQDDGVSIGTISISTGGVFTFTTTSGTAKTVAAGSIVTFISDSISFGASSNISVALRGTI